MADFYLLEGSAVDGYLLEDGTGVLLLEAPAVAPEQTFVMFPAQLDGIGHGGIFPGGRLQ